LSAPQARRAEIETASLKRLISSQLMGDLPSDQFTSGLISSRVSAFVKLGADMANYFNSLTLREQLAQLGT